ncbi:ethanolamine ammonia-lyase subunit EutC [Granulicella arctica]|uniref:ethanolamine ammonia-lyase subunit EutC n=1 Tax=Granulicella arctica TaxID=940613 RepID=UPI0021E0964F|nr:ethanolamine ammonia-lyase subunit EutC [Granulicella arctica]
MDELRHLRQGESTPARVGLGITGVSLPTRSLLTFQMDQAFARDAIQDELATVSLVQEIAALRSGSALQWTSEETPVLHSAARDRNVYLRRPDLGRRLAEAELAAAPCDLAIVLADGLSALAVNRHAVPLLTELLPLLAAGTTLGPISLVVQGRVAIGDEIGERLGARMLLMLIGERPGLSAPDSLGAYLTWNPRIGRTDAERNCVSNIRPEGLSYEKAAQLIHQSMATAVQQQLTGVALNRRIGQHQPVAQLLNPMEP